MCGEAKFPSTRNDAVWLDDGVNRKVEVKQEKWLL